MSDYKNIQDVLPDDFTKLNVYKSTAKGSDVHRQAKNGSWMYYTKWGGEYYNLFAKEEEKEWFDSGVVYAKCGTAKGGGRWINYYRNGDIETQPQNQAAAQSSPQPAPTVNQPPVDDVQERIIRGMCFNNACTLLGQLPTEKGNYSDALKEVREMAMVLYHGMKPWLTSQEESASSEPPSPEMPQDPEFQEKIDTTDLPFA